MAWLELAACLAVIAFAGFHLSRFGDILAEKTGMSASWVGLILLSTATSLPELVTGLSAVTFAAVPDIAVGDALGSTVFNLAILVLVDALYRRETLYSQAGQGHLLSVSLGAFLLAFTGFSLLFDQGLGSPAIGHVGLYSLLLLAAYLVAMRAVYGYERHIVTNYVDVASERYAGVSLRHAVRGYLLAALGVVAAGSWLPGAAGRLSLEMGWEQSFVGTLLVAAVTSAPEAAVTFFALRLGALDMAIANLLGSNLFDMAILALDDLCYLPGPLFAHVSPSHALTVLTALMMSALVAVGFIFRPKTRLVFGLTWVSLGLLMLYALNSWILFEHAPR